MTGGADPATTDTGQRGTGRRSASSFVVRGETPGDAAAVHHVVRDAFGEQSVADLVDSLRESPDWIDGLSFVAVEGDRVVGHVLFTRSRLDTPTRLIDVLQLSPLSVAADRQRIGIGSALVRHALSVLTVGESVSGAAPVTRMPLLFLEGSPNYYSRFGFVAAGALGFRRPSLRIPPAAFQVIALPEYQPWMTGTLIYSDVFWQHDAVGLRDEEGTTWPD